MVLADFDQILKTKAGNELDQKIEVFDTKNPKE